VYELLSIVVLVLVTLVDVLLLFVDRRFPEAGCEAALVVEGGILMVVVDELIVEVVVLLVCVVVVLDLVVVLVALVVVLIVVVVVVIVVVVVEVEVTLLGRKARIITPVVAQSKINTTPAKQQESCGVKTHRKHCLRSHWSDTALSLSKAISSWAIVESVCSTGGS